MSIPRPLQQPEGIIPMYLAQALVQSPVKLFLLAFHNLIEALNLESSNQILR